MPTLDRKSTRLNSSHQIISYAVFCLKKKKHRINAPRLAASKKMGLPNPVQPRIAQIQVWRGHIDLCAQHMLAFPEFARFFLFNETATTEIYTLSLHDALPI